MVAFTVFAVLSTQAKGLRAHSPWQDDPYDVVVSFTMFIVPLVAAAAVARAQLCRADRPVAPSRILDLQRAGDAVLVGIALTVMTDWVAVALGTHQASWGADGTLLIAGLLVVSLAAIVAGVAVRRAHHAAASAEIRINQSDPDWCDDALELFAATGTRLGGLSRPADRVQALLRTHVVDGRWGLRRRPLLAAVLAALAFGTSLSATQTLVEGTDAAIGPALGYALLVVAIATAGMFTLLVVTGSYLRIARAAATEEKHSRGHFARALLAAATLGTPHRRLSRSSRMARGQPQLSTTGSAPRAHHRHRGSTQRACRAHREPPDPAQIASLPLTLSPNLPVKDPVTGRVHRHVRDGQCPANCPPAQSRRRRAPIAGFSLRRKAITDARVLLLWIRSNVTVAIRD